MPYKRKQKLNLISTIIFFSLLELVDQFLKLSWSFVWYFYSGDAFNIAFYGTLWHFSIVFWSSSLFFMAVDFFKPNFIYRYKIQSEKNIDLKLSDLKKPVKTALVNQFIVGVPAFYAFAKAMIWRGCSFDVFNVPSLPKIFIDILIFLVFQEIGFYYTHR